MEKRRKAKKRFSALTSFLLALALLTGTLGALPAECFAAQPEKAAFHSTYGFRLGSSAKMELQFRDKLEKNYKVNGNTYYGSQTDLSRQLRDQMVKRSDQVVLRLATDRRGLTGRSNSATQAREELFLGLLNDATSQRNSVSARDGDYLRWQLGTVSGVLYADGSKNGVYYYRVIYYGLGYYTTAAEEQWVDRYVQKYVRRVDRNKMSDYDLAKKVHDDVCRATVYDMEMDSRYDDYDFSAYGCLYVGRCVCQGYALAYYRLCRELGLSVRFVYSDPHEGCHAWNLVQVGGKYYYVDCTWDDTYHEGNIVYNFFLKNYTDLQAMDSDYHEHRLDDGVYADADYTGTKDSRPEFQRLLADCRAGKIDRVLTKSLSRFARNTVDSLVTIRKLKEKGVEVYFEKENIYTFDGKGELLLTIMSSLAQEAAPYPRMLPGDRENGLPMERSTSHTSSSSAIAKERTVFQKSFRRRQSLSTGFILDSWRG